MSLLGSLSCVSILLPGIPAVYYMLRPVKTENEVSIDLYKSMTLGSVALLAAAPAIGLMQNLPAAMLFGSSYALSTACALVGKYMSDTYGNSDISNCLNGIAAGVYASMVSYAIISSVSYLLTGIISIFTP